MDAVKFLEEAKRMCNYTGDCKGCPLETEKNSANCILWATPNAIDNPGEIVSKVETYDHGGRDAYFQGFSRGHLLGSQVKG